MELAGETAAYLAWEPMASEQLLERHLVEWREGYDPATDPFPHLSQGYEERVRKYWGPTSALSEWQDGRCAICGIPDGADLVTDHDHRTALIRGLLCRSCNTSEGMTTTYGHPAFDAYRENPPAAVLGIEEIYWSPFGGFAEPAPPPLSEEEQWAATKEMFRKIWGE